MPPSICIIGGASVDTIIHLEELPAPRPQTIWPRLSYRAVGSTGAGKALNLKPLGINVSLHTLLGRDQEAEMIKAAMARAKIPLLYQETQAPTEQHVNLMAPGGQRISLFTHPPADPGDIEWTEVEGLIREADLCVVNILSYARPALLLAKKHRKPLWTDLHDYDGQNPYHQPFIDAADVIFLSSDNLPGYRSFMQRCIEEGKAFVVCTHGDKGATLLTAEGEWLEQPVFKVAQVKDTNGAGDAFFSGFVHGYLQGKPLTECLRLAAACGALCVQSDQLAGEQLSAEQLESMLAAV